MTGRGFGYCRAGAGLGRGFGMGLGYGWRAGAWAFEPFTPTVESQRQVLINEQKFLEARLEALKARISALDTAKNETP